MFDLLLFLDFSDFLPVSCGLVERNFNSGLRQSLMTISKLVRDEMSLFS